MTELEKTAFLTKLSFNVSYNGRKHITTYHGAVSLLNGCLKKAGVIRDASAAVLRAFEEKCLADDWHYRFEAGVIDIEKIDEFKDVCKRIRKKR